jgi:hypothetical protein
VLKLEILKKAKESIAKMENIAFLSMLLTLLVSLWTIKVFDIRSGFFGFGSFFVAAVQFWPLLLLFVVSAALALAMKKYVGLLIAVPYFVLLGDGFFGLMWYLMSKFKERGVPVEVIVLFAAVSLPGYLIALLWNKDEARKIKIYQLALIIQVVIALAAVFLLTASTVTHKFMQ